MVQIFRVMYKYKRHKDFEPLLSCNLFASQESAKTYAKYCIEQDEKILTIVVTELYSIADGGFVTGNNRLILRRAGKEIKTIFEIS